MGKKLLGSGSPTRSKTSPKGMGGVSLLDDNLSPAYRGDEQTVVSRESVALQGKRLHDQLKKNESGSSPL
jgi:hypothetical protein